MIASPVIAWWEARSRREQVLLAVLAAGLGLFILWFGVHRPLAQARADAALRYDRALRDEAVVRAAALGIRALERGAPAPKAAASPAEAVSASAAAAGLTLGRVEPDPGGGVRVAVGGVSPGQLFPWLAALQQDYGVTPAHLAVVKDAQGTLSADATFGGTGR